MRTHPTDRHDQTHPFRERAQVFDDADLTIAIPGCPHHYVIIESRNDTYPLQKQYSSHPLLQVSLPIGGQHGISS